jgi:hypothetical protein
MSGILLMGNDADVDAERIIEDRFKRGEADQVAR